MTSFADRARTASFDYRPWDQGRWMIDDEVREAFRDGALWAREQEPTEVTCGACGGTGSISDVPGCPDCYGTGVIPVEQEPTEESRIRADERRRVADLIAQDRSSNDFMSRFLDEYAYEANRRAEDIVLRIAEEAE